MKKILWLSRHPLTDAQFTDLKRIYGDIEIVKCDITVNGWRDVVEAGKECDILAVVLPPAILADLVNPRQLSEQQQIVCQPAIRFSTQQQVQWRQSTNSCTRLGRKS